MLDHWMLQARIAMLVAIPSLIGVVIVTFLLTRALPGDPAAYFAGPAADQGGDRADPREARPRQAAARAVRPLCRRSRRRAISAIRSPPASRSLTEISNRLPASAELTLLGLIVSMSDRGAARHPRGGEAGLVDRSHLPRGGDRRRVAAGVLHRADPGLCLLLSCSAGRRRRSAGSTCSSRRRRRSPASI